MPKISVWISNKPLRGEDARLLRPEWELPWLSLKKKTVVDGLVITPSHNSPNAGGFKYNRWFAARPSGTEDSCKIYAESLKDEDHLAKIQSEAEWIISETPQD
jgi:phosphoglucomutase